MLKVTALFKCKDINGHLESMEKRKRKKKQNKNRAKE